MSETAQQMLKKAIKTEKESNQKRSNTGKTGNTKLPKMIEHQPKTDVKIQARQK